MYPGSKWGSMDAGQVHLGFRKLIQRHLLVFRGPGAQVIEGTASHMKDR